jgi:hypothetical protein
MSIGSNGTASDVNTLLKFLMPSLNEFGSLPSDEEARAAAIRLAEAAYKKLYAGALPDRVAGAWDEHCPGPSRVGRHRKTPA